MSAAWITGLFNANRLGLLPARAMFSTGVLNAQFLNAQLNCLPQVLSTQRETGVLGDTVDIDEWCSVTTEDQTVR